MPKRKRSEIEPLEGTFYVKEILKERTRRGRKEVLVSWKGFNEEDNISSKFSTRNGRDLSQPNEETEEDGEWWGSWRQSPGSLISEDGQESEDRFSTKSRTARGTFAKNSVEELSNADKKMPHIVHSWRNYVRYFFDQHPGFKASCCGKSYDKTETFLTHRRRCH